MLLSQLFTLALFYFSVLCNYDEMKMGTEDICIRGDPLFRLLTTTLIVRFQFLALNLHFYMTIPSGLNFQVSSDFNFP